MTRDEAMYESTRISVSAIAQCPFSAALDYAIDFLEKAKRSGGRAKSRLRHPTRPWHGTLAHMLDIDELEMGRGHHKVDLHWTSAPWLLESCHGAIRPRISYGRTQLFVDFVYTPRGRLGWLLDRLVLRRLTERWLQTFADGLADHLGRAHQAWLSVHAESRKIALHSSEPRRAAGEHFAGNVGLNGGK